MTHSVRDSTAHARYRRRSLLLGSEEQALFRRLAVSTGGLTLEAAEWVADRVASGRSPNVEEDDTSSTSRHPQTVRNHVTNIPIKPGVESRTAAATFAVRHGVI
jgi:hypothetical protein